MKGVRLGTGLPRPARDCSVSSNARARPVHFRLLGTPGDAAVCAGCSYSRSIRHRELTTRVHPASLCLWRSEPPGGGARLCVFRLSGLSGR
jgi:hypothetical protein